MLDFYNSSEQTMQSVFTVKNMIALPYRASMASNTVAMQS